MYSTGAINESQNIIGVPQVGETIGLGSLSPEILIQASVMDDVNRKIDSIKTELKQKSETLKAYSLHLKELEFIHDKNRGGGGTKIYQSFRKTDFSFNIETGQVEKHEGGKLRQKDPLFGKAYTPKAALTAEIERLKKVTDSLKKDISQLEMNLKELQDRKKGLLDEMAQNMTKLQSAQKDLNQRA